MHNGLIEADLLHISKHVFCLQRFYEYIDAAEILEDLRRFLTHEDSNLRAKTCSAIGNMCRHSSYFYSLLVCIVARFTPFWKFLAIRLFPLIALVALTYILTCLFSFLQRQSIISSVYLLIDVLILINGRESLPVLL